MTIHRLRRIHKNQRGITLPELLIVVVIIGLISGGIALLISRTITGSARDSDHMIVVRQVQQVGKDLSTDVLQAQWTKSDHDSGFPLRLWWKWEGQPHEIIYELRGTDLVRIHNDAEKVVARHIVEITAEPAPHDEPHPGGILTFTVTASFGEQQETRVYEVEPRSRQRDRPNGD